MRTSEAESPDATGAGKTTKIGVLAPMSIILFIALTLAGTYYVRKGILERAMWDALKVGDEATVAELADSFPCPLEARDKEGRTPLYWAEEWGDPALVGLLLNKGADPNAKVGYGWTALHAAAEHQHNEVAELLIAAGADVNARSAAGWTPLHDAASGGAKDIAEMLLAKGADPNAKNEEGRTPLDLSIACHNFNNVAEILIAKGADVNINDQLGGTPLHCAVSTRQKPSVDLLIAKGADVNARDGDGMTPLTLSMELQCDDIEEALRKAGAKE